MIRLRKRKKAGKRSKQAAEVPYGRFLRRNPGARYWIEVGLKPRSAVALYNAGLYSLEHLSALQREDLLSIRGVSEVTVAVCEQALGRPLPSPLDNWTDLGLGRGAAGVLVRAGVHSVEQLEEMTREDVLALQGMGYTLVAEIEEALGARLSSRSLGFWLERGFPRRTAKVLDRAGIVNLEQLAKRRGTLNELGLNALELRMVEVVLGARGR